MTTRTLFVSGASGFIGRALLRRLSGKDAAKLVCWSRNVSASPERNATWIVGSLQDRARLVPALTGVDAVVHLAAATGKRAPADFERANVDGTRALLDACREAGVRRFCLVSTIAVNYEDLRAYPYARSKQLAERAVRESGLDWAVVRPTIVLGKKSPVWQGLAGLLRLPVVPAFGGGRARIQPVHVSDVAEALATWVDDPSLDRAEHEIGGPQVLTFADFLRQAHEALTGRPARLMTLPARSLIRPLWALEGPLRPLLPLTAGQLYAFVHDSTARPGPLSARLSGRMRSVADMLAELSGRARAGQANEGPSPHSSGDLS